MEALALRLSGLDPYAGGAIRIVAFYDTLMRRRVDLPALARASAGLAECVTGIRVHGTGRAVRVSPLGTEADAPAPPAPAPPASTTVPVTLDEEEIGEVWLERPGPPNALDEVLLDRLAIAVAAAVERYGPARTTMADPALVELAVAPTTDPAARARALRLLGFAPGRPVQAVAVRSGLPLDRIGARICPAGLVKAAVLAAPGGPGRPAGPGGYGGLAGHGAPGGLAGPAGPAGPARSAGSGGIDGQGGAPGGPAGLAGPAGSAGSGGIAGQGAHGGPAGPAAPAAPAGLAGLARLGGPDGRGRPAVSGGEIGVLLTTAVDPARFPDGVRAGVADADSPETSWRQARTALRFTTDHQPVVHYADLGALALLADVPDAAARANPDVAALARAVAGPEGQEALETLDAYCATASLRRAAERLHLHHSSVSRRLDQLGKALGLDLTAPTGLTRARLALTAWRLLADGPEPGRWP
ncbi:helix-turn-helix domain-containing protein [Streptomyces sp. NPDC127114]|uniref:helix-turn-helix domain-containing protein n=1 Tax=Streptomyces sp. NPDC127114 TaxID=3345366 RepID=UPI00364437C5